MIRIPRDQQTVLDVFFYRKEKDYVIYAVTNHSAFLVRLTDKKDEVVEISMKNLTFFKGCSDCDPRSGTLLASQLMQEGPDGKATVAEAAHYLKSAPRLSFQIAQEGERKFTRLYKNHYVIVSAPSSKEMLLCVYDIANEMQYFQQSFHKVHDLVVDGDALFVFVTPSFSSSAKSGASAAAEQRCIVKLAEISSIEKIKVLLKRSLFKEATMIAMSESVPDEIKAVIAKEHGDHKYKNGQFDQAMEEYVKTIGFEAPSYVIERFLEVQKLDFLILYLETLIDTPVGANSQMLGDNKDYTALLLNCYVKQEQTDKIKQLMNRNRGTNTIFDVKTAIEVCRQKKDYKELAKDLALKYGKWKLLVTIYVEDFKNVLEAVKIIDEKIKKVRKKVKILQTYGAKLFKDDGVKIGGKHGPTLEIVQKIANFLIAYAKSPKQASEKVEYLNYQMDEGAKVKLSDLLKIFVDQNEVLEVFLTKLIETHGDDVQRIAGKMHVHHRLLECLLHNYSARAKEKFRMTDTEAVAKKKIQDYIVRERACNVQNLGVKKEQSEEKLDKN